MEALIIAFIKIVIVLLVLLTAVAYSVYAERRISAFIQDRLGPNRVGPFGLLQPIADVVKLVFKEAIVPRDANKPLHDLAPVISLSVALSTFAVIPFGNTITVFNEEIKLIIADVNIGVLFILAFSSISVYGIAIAGWSSNNKYSLMGSLRSSAQMISYELSLGLAVVGVILVTGSLRLDQVVLNQTNYLWGIIPAWNCFVQPIGFITFVVAAFAETNRLPFDLPEAEPELVGGFHTEYSGLKFGLFFLAEYAHMIVASAIITTLYLGGWHLPYIDLLDLSPMLMSIIGILTFATKVILVLLFMITIRWTIPRFRYDQLMALGWKVMFPMALLNIFVTGLILLIVR
jgi:NADH-quinone oxidoreductase subunit H